MTPLTPREDPAFAPMTLDILGNILSRAENPGDLGTYLTEEIRELTGARCVLFLQCQSGGISDSLRVIGINPQRMKSWAESPSAARILETVNALPEIRLWRGNEPSETTDGLKQEGFELSLSVPLNIGASRVGTLLILGLPDELHLASVVDLLSTLSTTLALVLRNAFLFETQEEIIRERTVVLQETNERLQSELTERKRAEEAVSRSERKYRELVENANSIILRWSTDGTITFLNEFGLKFFGYQESEIVGRSVMETIVPETESSGRNLAHLMDDILKNPQEFEHNINENRCQDGRRVWIAWTNKVVLGNQGQIQEVLSIGTDITELKAAETRIARLSQLYAALSQCNQAIVRSASVDELLPQICRDVVEFGGMKMAWIGMVDEATGRVRPVASFGGGTEYLEGIEISVDAENPSGRGPVGTSIRENQPTWFQDFLNDPRAAPWHERGAQYGWEAVASLPLRRRGKPIAALVIYSARALAFDEEICKLLVEMANDISFALDSFAREAERKQAGEALRKSEKQHRIILQTAMDGFYRVDTKGRLLEVNDAYCRMTGFSVQELLAMNVSELEAVETSEGIATHIQAIMRKGGDRFESRHRRKDGSIFDIEASVQFRSDSDIMLVVFIRDITERKRAEAALKESEARLRRAVVESPFPIMIHAEGGEVLMISNAWTETTGYTLSDIPTTAIWAERAYGERKQSIQKEIQNLYALTSKLKEGEYVVRTKTGEERVWDFMSAPLGTLNDGRRLAISMAMDITERKRMEDALKQSKEAAETANQAKDQFIAVLSHELRTPLTPVLATLTALNAEDGLPPEVHADLEIIRQNVELEARLIDDLLDVTRIAKGKMTLVQEPMDAHACFRTALEICQSEIEEKRLNLSLDLRADRHFVNGDSTRLRQVFWNLLKNAAKFTPPGGSISIKSANVNERLIIEITDTGIGIEPELLPQIFNQFEQGERTKTRHFGGLGLGLSIAKTVVGMHQGALTAASEGKGKGATFTVELDTIVPIDILSPRVVSPPPSMPENMQGQRLLLVEDHPQTLRILAKMLQKWGYSVTTAQTVRAALELAQAQPFDLLVSDLGLPDGSGTEIMRRLKNLYSIRGIAVSGFGTEEDIRQSQAAGFEDHLIKPISYESLRNAIQRIATVG